MTKVYSGDMHLETHELLQDNLHIIVPTIGIIICLVILYKMFKKEFGRNYSVRAM